MVELRLGMKALLVLKWIVGNSHVGSVNHITQDDIQESLVELNKLRAMANYEPKPWLLKKMVEWWVLPDIDSKIMFLTALLYRGEFMVGVLDGGGFVMDYTTMRARRDIKLGETVSGDDVEADNG